MTRQEKLTELNSQFDEMLKDVKTELMKKATSILNSGAIDHEISDLMESNFVLAKILITLYFELKPYTTYTYQRELENLRHFI